MKKLVICLSLFIASCTAQQAKDVTNTVLSIADIACIMDKTVNINDEGKVAEACGLAQALIPTIRQLVATRNAARRNGVTWQNASIADGGTHD